MARDVRKSPALAFKRLVDVGGSLAGLALLSPLLAIIALGVRVTLGRPVFFVQERPGLGGRVFRIYKFRTMRDHRDDEGRLLPDAERLTRLGRFLRSTSLDELPELFNVLKGEMSLVGPRPLLPQYLELYSSSQARRHEMRPGLTGWAQVNGRNAQSWRDRLAADVWYVDHWSLGLDLRILAITIAKIISREGINPPGQDVMPVFAGASDIPPLDNQAGVDGLERRGR